MTSIPAAYYLLTETCSAPKVGDYLTDLPLPAGDYITANPRLIAFAEVTDATCLTGALAGDVLRLARLAPLGEVTELLYDNGRGETVADDRFFACAGGWKVEALEGIEAMLGPQAEQIKAQVTVAERILNFDEDEEISKRFSEATDEAWDAIQSAEAALNEALADHGADTHSWGMAFSDVYGHVFLALAARDLLNEDTDWNQAAYEAMTGPWRVAFGRPIHPQDAEQDTARIR